MPSVPLISMTKFVDFVAKSGSPKLTVVRETKKQLEEGYHPSQDFYLGFRRAIARFHRDDLTKQQLRRLAAPTDAKKEKHYRELIDGYLRFIGRKTVTAYPAPRRVVWDQGDLQVSVNPEVALEVKGEKVLVKLYLKAPALKKNVADISTHLLRIAAPRKYRDGWDVGLLDVRRGRLFVSGPQKHDLSPLLEGEAASFASIFDSI